MAPAVTRIRLGARSIGVRHGPVSIGAAVFEKPIHRCSTKPTDVAFETPSRRVLNTHQPKPPEGPELIMGIFKHNATPRKSWLARYREYAANCTTSGFIPTESPALQRFAKLMSRVWSWIQIGEVKVVGIENLNAPGRLIYCPNHSAMLDAIVLYPLMPMGTRFMSAVEEMRGMGGLKAILMGAAGAYPVDRTRGRTVIPVSIDLLVKGKRITLFPEGKISPTGEYLEFKKGAAWIALGAHTALQQKNPADELVGIVPIHICYGTRDPASATDFGKMRLRWRHGVTITFGKPVYVHDVKPQTPAAMIERIKDTITGQACDTTSLADTDDTN